MTKKRVFRMSGPAVVIGFILLVPSIFGMLFGVLTFVATIVGSSSVPTPEQRIESIRSGLTLQNIPNDVIDDVIAGKHVTESRLSRLNTFQRSAVRDAGIQVSAAKAAPSLAACCGGRFSVMIMIGSFVGGLLGWLLVMRKSVLQCFRCGAVVAAS
jgi:hypothetical protein